jgi:hypothetical protein
MKCITEYSIKMTFKEQELEHMMNDLRNMGLIHLMEFRKHWNHEIIMQFYASYQHEKDTTGAVDIIHWTTEGQHYKVDFATFSRLLGFNRNDRDAAELSDYDDVVMEEYQHMYLDGYPADGQTVYLKPYYYVLNNILRQIFRRFLIGLVMISRSFPSATTFGTRFMMLRRIPSRTFPMLHTSRISLSKCLASASLLMVLITSFLSSPTRFLSRLQENSRRRLMQQKARARVLRLQIRVVVVLHLLLLPPIPLVLSHSILPPLVRARSPTSSSFS